MYTYRCTSCHHQNDSCIKMGSDENHFNVSLIVRDKNHKTMSTNHNVCEEKGQPKRNRAEALPLTSLTPCLPLGHTGLALAIRRVPAQYRPLIKGCFKLGMDVRGTWPTSVWPAPACLLE